MEVGEPGQGPVLRKEPYPRETVALVQGPLESGSLTGPVEMKLRGQRDGAFGHGLATLLDLGRGVPGMTMKAGGERGDGSPLRVPSYLFSDDQAATHRIFQGLRLFSLLMVQPSREVRVLET